MDNGYDLWLSISSIGMLQIDFVLNFSVVSKTWPVRERPPPQYFTKKSSTGARPRRAHTWGCRPLWFGP